MDRNEFESEIEELFYYFRVKQPSVKDTVFLWFKECEYIKSEVFLWSIEKIKNSSDNIPRNLPKNLKALSFEFFNVFPNKNFQYTKFDRIKDSSYPIDKLYEASDVLEENGVQAFETFCKINRMPLNSQEAVVRKHERCNDCSLPDLIKKIGTAI